MQPYVEQNFAGSAQGGESCLVEWRSELRRVAAALIGASAVNDNSYQHDDSQTTTEK